METLARLFTYLERVAGRFSLPYGPRGFQVAVGAWSLCTGLSLLLTDEAFKAFPVYYAGLREMGAPENALGAFMVAHACAVAFMLTYEKRPQWLPAAVSAVGGVCWLLVGYAIAGSTLRSGIFSGGGWFSILAGIGSFVSVVQFARSNGNGGR